MSNSMRIKLDAPNQRLVLVQVDAANVWDLTKGVVNIDLRDTNPDSTTGRQLAIDWLDFYAAGASYGNDSDGNPIVAGQRYRTLVLMSPPEKQVGTIGTGSGSLTCCKIVAIPGGMQDYFQVQRWDGSSLTGEIIKVAKAMEFRPSVTSAILDGVPITWTYSNDNNRTASDGTLSQDEVCYPRYTAGLVTWIMQADHTLVTVSGAELQWIEVNPSRFWLRKDVTFS